MRAIRPLGPSSLLVCFLATTLPLCKLIVSGICHGEGKLTEVRDKQEW